MRFKDEYHLTMTSYLSDVTERAVRECGVPGAAVMAAGRDGSEWAAFAGESRQSTPWGADTVAWVASMTKPVVAVAVLRLVEDGVLRLDDDVADALPELARLPVLTGFDQDGEPVLQPSRTPITLRRLLTHTAGAAYSIWNRDIHRYQALRGIPDLGECRTATLATPLAAEPGSRFEYGMGFEWIGRLVEAVTSEPLEQTVRREVLDPLGLDDTGFRLDDARRARRAMLAHRTPEGVHRREHLVPQDPELLMAGGAMYTTPRDYLTFLRMLLGEGSVGGVRVLEPDTVRAARANQIGELTVGAMRTAEPANSLDIEFLPGTTKRWSLLGLRNEETAPGGRSPGSLFWAGLTNCYFWVDWDRGDTGLVLTQLLPFGDPAVLGLFDDVERRIHALGEPTGDTRPHSALRGEITASRDSGAPAMRTRTRRMKGSKR